MRQRRNYTVDDALDDWLAHGLDGRAAVEVADPSHSGGMTAIYQHLAADEQRTRQIIADVLAALGRDRNCLVFTNRTSHLERLAGMLREARHDPVILRGGMGAVSRAAALARFQPQPGGPLLLAVATGPYAGEGFDCPVLDTLFLAAMLAKRAPG